jgi:23S rRNA (adenine2030-N6)-methyltransferase
MNYRHIFHAGNFADVFKHWVLTLLLIKLTEKETPFCFFDSHAGVGLYDLNHESAQKTLEAQSGAALMHGNTEELFSNYMAILNQLNEQYYPGSPKIAESFLRPWDRMFLSELHKDDYAQLCHNFPHKRQVKIFNQDGYEMLKANLPPQEKRGLVLLDPPFEVNDEFTKIVHAMQESCKRFATGIYAIWYPIKDQHTVNTFYQNMQQIGFTKILCVELHTNTAIANELNSCGMMIINAPWKLNGQLVTGMPLLLKQLGLTSGTYTIKNLGTEL